MAEVEKQFRVSRYKQGQAAPIYQTFTIKAGPRTTVLEALQEIRRTQDRTLILRHSCHHASCGTCGMRVNGQEVLACVTNVQALGTDTVLVEPIRNIPLVADLVVDMGTFYDRYGDAGMPYIRQSEFLTAATLPEGIPQYTRYENCLECGLCVSACPIMGSSSDYYGPAALAAAWRIVAEPRDQDARTALDWVDNENGCWRCHVAYECTEVCPSDVDPGGSIMSLRRKLTGRKFRRLLRLE